MQTKSLRKLWMSVSGEDSERMVGLLDANHNGQISLDEFRRFVYLLPESLVRAPSLDRLHVCPFLVMHVINVHLFIYEADSVLKSPAHVLP